MKKSVIYLAFMIFVLIFGIGIVNAASADLHWSGDNDAILGEDFYQDIEITDISGARVVGIGGEVSVTNESCLTFDSIENVDVNADANGRKFSFMSLAGTNLNKVIVKVKLVPGASECTTTINILNPTISFTSGPSLKPSTITKEIHVKAAANNDATLKSLSVTDRTLSPNFDPEETSYKVNIPNDVTSAYINAEANDDNAGVVGTGLKENLEIGDNLKSITVTAEDGTIKIYQVNLHRISNDALLKSLTVGSYSLSPNFGENIFSYIVNIPNNVTSVSINGTPKYDLATVSGNETYNNLAIGDNVKTITVTAEDGETTQDYVVNLHRLSNSVDVNSLTIKNTGDNSTVSYTPSFSKNTLTYNATVGDDVSSVSISLTSTDSSVTITGDGVKTLSFGNNSFPILVTAEDGVTKKTYTVNIKKVSSSFSVTGLTIVNTSDNSNIPYTPTFDQETLIYNATVGSGVNSVDISFVTSDGVTVTGAGTKSLNIGDNSFPIVITASDGVTKKNYTVNIHKKSNVIAVSNLKIKNVANNSDVSYSPAFNKDTLTYNASVTADVNTVNISFVTTDNTVTISGDGNKTLNLGNNTFNVIVTAEDGVTKKTYTINIKKLSNDVTTTGLAIKNVSNNSNIPYSPKFDKDILVYEAVVMNDVNKININLTKGNNNATITGNGTKNLAIGDNTFTVVVTAEDGVTKKTYTINVTRSEIITSVEFGHNISDGYIKTVANVMPDGSDTTVLDLKNQLDNDNSKLEVWTADGTTKLGEGDRVATGQIVKLIVKGTLADSKVIVIKGDTSGDSDINIIDASAIVNHFLERIYLEGAYLVAADINDDGDINIIDASAIVNHFLERIKIVFKP